MNNQAYRQPWQDVTAALAVDPEQGLSTDEAKKRIVQYGPNELHRAKDKSVWAILFDQVKSLIVGLLVVAALLSFAFGEWTEGIAIVIVIVLNTLIGFVTEFRARKSMAALKRLGAARVTVRRDGAQIRLGASDLVPGDMVVVTAGDVIAAEIRLVEASNLESDESLLTGESLPVAKQIGPVASETVLAERCNILHRGSSVTRGDGLGVVIQTGMQTELGHISAMIEAAPETDTPLQERLDKLGYWLVWLTVGIAVLVVGLGVANGKPLFLMVYTGIALAVAAIPEGLPVVATLALSRGVWRMAERNALINRLTSVATLGGTAIICADKTGTLTENRLSVAALFLHSGELAAADFNRAGGGRTLESALEIAVLCNTALLGEKGHEHQGDPLEIALLTAAASAGVGRRARLAAKPEIARHPFDPVIKMMATVHSGDGGTLVAVKGAPEAIIERADRVMTENGPVALDTKERDRWLLANTERAARGGRMLALAFKDTDDDVFQGLTLVGLVTYSDPLRDGVPEAVRSCRAAGIRVIMVTGDQPETARAIACQAGVTDEMTADVVHGRDLGDLADLSEAERERMAGVNIFARMTPGQKLDLVTLHQHRNAVVAMTGDGVNDAPALKQADIGIAMGLRGTDVAREAADMVLKDDSFITIVEAVRQGRIIFTNIRRFVMFLLATNMAEVLVIFIATAAGAALPLLPLQILFLNLITDVFPALALGFCEGEHDEMKKPPRPADEPILAARHWKSMFAYGILMAAVTLVSFALAQSWLGMSPAAAVTVSFTTLASSQILHVFNMRTAGSSFFFNDITRNPYIWAALALCGALMIGAIYLPGISYVLGLTDPGSAGWLLIVTLTASQFLLAQMLKSLGALSDIADH